MESTTDHIASRLTLLKSSITTLKASLPDLQIYSVLINNYMYMHTVEAPVSGHPREAEILMSAPGAGRLRECVKLMQSL